MCFTGGHECLGRMGPNSSRLALCAMSHRSSAQIPVLLMGRELGLGGTERQLVETARLLQGEQFLPHVGCFRPLGVRRQDLDSALIPILHLPVYSFKSWAVAQAALQLAAIFASMTFRSSTPSMRR